MMTFLLGFGCALFFSAISMPVILKFAHSRQLYDSFNARKIHSGNIPRLGGLGIFFGFSISILVSAVTRDAELNNAGWIWIVLTSMIIIFTIGLIDDFQEIRARFKFLLELAVALIMVTQGFHFISIRLPFGVGSVPIGACTYILTFFWIIGVTNSINLIDGMDGLAGGIACFAAIASGIFFLVGDDPGAALVCFSLFGAVLGFLFFNLNPARIFMGDAGALFLGFSLAALPLIGPASGKVEISFVPAVTMLIIPIFDTFSSIIRRVRARVSIFTPDKLHLHHKLLDLGLGSRGALLVIYGAQVILCLVALTYLFAPIDLCFFLNIGMWIVFAGLFYLVARLATKKRAESNAQIVAILERVGNAKRIEAPAEADHRLSS